MRNSSVMPGWTRIVLHTGSRRRRLVDPAEVYYLEATAHKTRVRLRGRTALVDLRSLGEIFPLFEPHGFVRVHRNHAVNIAHILELRGRSKSPDWELKLEPPVNRVLPIARGELPTLLEVLGSGSQVP